MVFMPGQMLRTAAFDCGVPGFMYPDKMCEPDHDAFSRQTVNAEAKAQGGVKAAAWAGLIVRTLSWKTPLLAG